MKILFVLILVFASAALQATPDNNIMSAQAVYRKASLSVVKIVSTLNDGTLQGSGVVIANGGKIKDSRKPINEKNMTLINSIIATNAHVVSRATSVMVVYKGKSHKADISFVDDKSDIAILQVDDLIVPKLQTSTHDAVSIGDKVYAIGSPLGLDNSLSEGIVSGIRESDGIKYIQTTASISPGNSGGGLFDEHGVLVGVTSFKMKNGENLNFALSTETLMKELDGYASTIVLNPSSNNIPPVIAALLDDASGRGKLTRFFTLTTDNGKSWFDTNIDAERSVLKTNNSIYDANWMNRMAQKYSEFAASEQNDVAKNPAPASTPVAHVVKLNCNFYNIYGTNMDGLVRVDFDKSTVNGNQADITEDYIRWNVRFPNGTQGACEINRVSGAIHVKSPPDPKLGYLPPSSGACTVVTRKQF